MKHLSGHFSDDQLLDRVYGLGESNIPHLQECNDCSGRLQAFERKRTETVAAASEHSNAEASNEFLMAQRRAIYARLDRAPATRAHWAPAAVAVVFLLVMGLFLVHPHATYAPVLPPDPAPNVELKNEQLFSDLYSMEQSVEPRAAAPIHALFEASDGDAQQ